MYIRPPQYGSRYTNACRGIPEPQILQKERITTKTITKNKLVALRFRENEYNLIKSKADKANMSFTEFVTRSALNKQITVVDGLPEILKEVKAIGRNLNQLTTLCNMGKIICPELGYGVKWIDRYKYITYTTPDGQRFRDNRLFDDKYLKENMED